jgi:hypothetical protein
VGNAFTEGTGADTRPNLPIEVRLKTQLSADYLSSHSVDLQNSCVSQARNDILKSAIENCLEPSKMENKSALPVLQEHKHSFPRINRREWIGRVLGGVTAGIAFPGLAASHPVRKHLASVSTLDMADAQAAAPNWKPEFLDAYQADTLDVLGERIVPGSSSAQVNRFIDTLLNVEKREDQQRFLDSLAAIDAESAKKYGHTYKDLTEAQQNELLTIASTMSGGHKNRPFTRRRRSALGPPASTSDLEHDTLRDHFENLKGWIVGAYFSSEAGMRELGWTGQVMFESFPGCEHPGGHA